jgi:hypothetical protein
MPIAFRPTTVEHLLAIEEIRLLVLSYSYCVDGGGGDIVGLFTEDGIWDSSDNGHPKLVGREALRGFFGSAEAREIRRQSGRSKLNHVVLSPLITDMGDGEAHGVCTYAGQVIFDGRPYVVQEAGRYHDHYVRTGDGWRFRARVLEHVFPSRSQEIHLVTSEESLGRKWPPDEHS